MSRYYVAIDLWFDETDQAGAEKTAEQVENAIRDLLPLFDLDDTPTEVLMGEVQRDDKEPTVTKELP